MSVVAGGRPFNVLLVEDNPGDVRLVMEALREGRAPKRVHVAADGVEALDYLFGRREQALPDLILLDLNLPRKSGHEVLAAIRSDESLRRTPVVIFTSSAADQDVRAAYELFANCYVVKPGGFSELMEAIRGIENFWLHTATLPYRLP
ncbi:MAG: response regulator [Bryobacteraceae bacterium]|nr:response regulator [Bryobacteraceae bacterium]